MGRVRSSTGLILPWPYHWASSPIMAALACGSRLAKSPQNTPTSDAPLSKGRFSGSDGDGAACKAHHQVAPAPGDGAEGGLGQIAAHGVVHHVGPLSLGQGFQGFAQVLGAVVDGGIGAQALCTGRIFRRWMPPQSLWPPWLWRFGWPLCPRHLRRPSTSTVSPAFKAARSTSAWCEVA
jgi:hypothetical protein